MKILVAVFVRGFRCGYAAIVAAFSKGSVYFSTRTFECVRRLSRIRNDVKKGLRLARICGAHSNKFQRARKPGGTKYRARGHSLSGHCRTHLSSCLCHRCRRQLPCRPSCPEHKHRHPAVEEMQREPTLHQRAENTNSVEGWARNLPCPGGSAARIGTERAAPEQRYRRQHRRDLQILQPEAPMMMSLVGEPLRCDSRIGRVRSSCHP